MDKLYLLYRFFLFILALVPGCLFAQSQVVNGQGIMTSPAGTEFLIYTPPGYSEGTPAPLLVNLHGQGQINPNLGTGCTSINCLRSQFQDATPAYLIDQGQWDPLRPFIVVSPQMKRDNSVPLVDQDWSAAYIDEVIEYVKTQRTINANKIYLMGLSLGGQGCMIYAGAFPQKVAGIVPICGKTYNQFSGDQSEEIITQACSLVNIPMWIFHGKDDSILPYTNATFMVQAINNCPNQGSIRPHVTLLDAITHNETWNPIYNMSADYPVYDWLLQLTKNATSNIPPVVSLGVNKRFLTTDGTIYLPAEYFDTDGSITSVQWTQTQGTPLLTLDQTNPSIVKISNLVAGTFQFTLTVTDNQGATGSDDITITLLGSADANRITGFTLVNAATHTNIGPLVNDQVINKSSIGVNDFNVRAALASPGDDVVFRVNSHQSTRRVGGWNADGITVFEIFPPNGWKIFSGDHVICATPNTANGITKCVKFSVTNPILQHYYPKPGADLSLLASWGNDPSGNGNGTSPGSFSGNFQVFNVNKAASQTGALTISGIESTVWVRNNGEMTVNNNFTGVINIEGNGIVNVNTSQPVTFGTVSPTSTVRFGANATTIPAQTYGHVEILGAGTTKTLGSDATIITGNLVIGNDVTVNGAANNTSNIQLTGNLTLLEDSEFNPVTKFSLTLSAGQPHAINLSGTKAVFNQLTILGNSVVSVTQGTLPKTLELGSTTGGGLIVHAGSELGLGKNHLTIIGSGTINPQNQTGRIAFDNSNLSVTSSSSSNSYLYTKPLVDHVSAVTANLTGAGALILQDSLFVAESVKMLNGTLNANGFLTLISTDDQTARIERVEGTGDITGDVRFQRYVRPGRMYRYLGFPVHGATVGDLQKRVPVTGNFGGRSTGPGLTTNPSLFYYTEPGGWLPYPTTTSAAEFSMGRGYAVFVRKADDPTTITVAGEVHTGDFPFQLNAGSALPNAGWSLLGNPYASPIQWGGAGWQSTGINPTVYIRDNEYDNGNGRFLWWDGEVGNEEEEFVGLIAQGQSFWVKAIAENTSLTVQETAKSTTQATLFRTKSEDASNLSISLNHNGLIDRTFLKFNNRSGLAFDPRYDGLKKENGYYNLSTLTADSVLVAIKNMPDTCTAGVTLSVQHTKPGTYTLEFSGSALETEREFFLQDNYLAVNVQVKSNQHYTFQITDDPNTFGHKRFQLLATVELPLPEISIEQDQLVSSVTADIQWLLNGEEIHGATEPNYTPLISGDYQVRVTKSSCSKTSPPFAYVITGIEPRQPAIQLYPNPAEHSVSVKGILKPTPYTLLNSWGQVVQTGLLTADHSEIELAFSSGLYILALEGETGIQRHKLIIKK
ncbi:MAG: T9SS type A sorting domain-containing protein [Cyclobacteriaceae bacterium]|nr:T9SS type A sorting domain-containing protein [Cyclobacteriaceae bacterium]